MFKRFLIGFIILCLGFSVFPNSQEAEASTTKNQLIIINKKVNKLAFYENGKLIKTYRVATGRTSRLTPEGTFYIREKIVNRPYYKKHIAGGDPRNPLGNRWIGLSKKENGGYPYAIHGNNNESSIGKYVSGGCIRMHNNEVRELFSKVKTRTKVMIVSSKKSFNQLAAPYYKNMDIKAPAVPTVNTVSDKTIEVSGKTEKGATVTVAIGSKRYTAKPADSKGTFKVKIPKQKAGLKLSFTAKDKSGNISKTKTVVVLDRTAPVVSGVSNNRVYNKDVTISFKEGTAWLDGNRVKTGKVVTTEGTHRVVLTDAAGNKTIVIFTIDRTAPVVSGVSNNAFYNKDVTIAFKEGTAWLDGNRVKTGKAVTSEGKHRVTIADAVGNKRTVVFTIDKTAPVVSGVSNDEIYNQDVTISFKEGTATLDGATVKTGTVVSAEGTHTLVVTDAAGNKTTVVFIIEITEPISEPITEPILP
ncbi:L,D-transpeptidase family protein [Bacillus sp. ISL-7]|uniref:L,D-transpeptidase family protein n=1 Tax=Bacillus sp. ISL-7 TaxID=2819136 RepID=UPI001BE9E0DB|nr:L,D-transpeptidase family protein [Bacillus sp. ISL-7]MBT2734695.1 L,D-transpeptidase family protein [Bacillus sp. ISL-7]